MDSRLSRLEAQASTAEKAVLSQASDKTALEATIKSAELYFQALRLADNPKDKQRLDAKVNGLLAQAERLKQGQDAQPSVTKPPRKQNLQEPVSTRKLTTRENIILLEGGKLNGCKFKPWTGPPTTDEFFHREGEALFTDACTLPLSATQLESFDGWKRPRQALPSVYSREGIQELPDEAAVMHLPVAMDLVQDMTSDCSVVASLCALTSRTERGFPKVLRTLMHPSDDATDRLIISPNGKYVFRLYFNGCWRRVEIDDYLPASKTSRVLHVIDRRHPRLLWPALVEKAYLKVRGGYDFPGSNSGTDLAVLTGWIPQQVFLHDHDVEPDCLWDEVVKHFNEGNLLVTIGTGKLPRREQRQLGLAAEHDYAVLDITANGGTRELLIKNPWADGDVWKGAARRRPNPTGEPEAQEVDEDNAMMPGTFWMDFNSVFQYFENMYLNWNPGLFSHRQDLHFSWSQDSPAPVSNLIVDNPQFAVTASKTGEIWLLLHRHFRTGDYSEATVGHNGYISLYLYTRDGKRVLSSEGAKVRGPFVDSPNTLLRIEASAGTTYTAVVASQDLPTGKLNFSISAFARSPIALGEAQNEYPQKYRLTSAWTRSNAGGNSDSPNYFSNPQFQLTLNAPQKIALVLRVAQPARAGEPVAAANPSADISVKMLIVFSNGSRITRLRPRDVLAHSGDYRRGSAVMETELGSGTYTLICSTFENNQYAEFCLDLHYSTSAKQQPLFQLPAEHAGRLHIQSAQAIFGNGTNRLLAPVTALRMSRVTFIARPDAQSSNTTDKARSSLFKATLEQGQGPYKSIIASSEADDSSFSSLSSGIRMDDADLRPDMCGPGTGGLWLVLERLAPQEGEEQGDIGVRSREEVLKVDMYADERVEVGAWGRGDG
ncbi:Calpain-like protease palB/RIM13 [Cladophialophora carrionii]|uniref:Calpain-like protease palB/RIM13 n=1 Tax=Cladophialophora carrionii TaxID=86049 RepID=A0A1C1CJV7_9EURO|nr:Calpain-like protease palB/RIM13 [Cladophialophora carrionii]